MPLEQLRYLLRSVETGKPAGDVVSLVPRDQRAAEILRQHPETRVPETPTPVPTATETPRPTPTARVERG